MLRKLIRPLYSPFCSLPSTPSPTPTTPDPLQSIRTKYSSNLPLQDYQYSKLISDFIKRKQSLSAYNLLIHSYLHNILLDKQIFLKIQRSLGQLETTYKDVLNQMYNKFFNTPETNKQKAIVVQKSKTLTTAKQNQGSAVAPENRKFQAMLRETANSKILQPEKLMKDGEAFVTDLFSKIDLERVTFKNVRINFDYEWIHQLEKLREEMGEAEVGNNASVGRGEQAEKELADDQVFASEEDEDDSYEDPEELTLQDMIRSIKSIDIGEVELVSARKDNDGKSKD